MLADLKGVDRMNLPQRDAGGISSYGVALLITGQVRGIKEEVPCHAYRSLDRRDCRVLPGPRTEVRDDLGHDASAVGIA